MLAFVPYASCMSKSMVRKYLQISQRSESRRQQADFSHIFESLSLFFVVYLYLYLIWKRVKRKIYTSKPIIPISYVVRVENLHWKWKHVLIIDFKKFKGKQNRKKSKNCKCKYYQTGQNLTHSQWKMYLLKIKFWLIM